MTVLSIIRNRLDALLHPSVRYDALTRARHRAFMAPRLIGSLLGFALFPACLAFRGAPGLIEVVAFASLTAPLLLAWFLSRTGRCETAYMLSSLVLAGLVTVIAATTGGIASFAAIWLILVPLESALSASRRAVIVATAVAGAAAGVLILLGTSGLLPPSAVAPATSGTMMAASMAMAVAYAAVLAFTSESLARANTRLLSREEERYRLLALNMSDVISRHDRKGYVHFISPAAETLLGASLPDLQGHGLFDRVHVADRPAYLTALSDAARGEARSVEFRVRKDGRVDERGQQTGPDFIWVEMRCKPFTPSGPRDGGGDASVVAVMRDVTDRKLQEQALELARKAAEQADAAKSRFLATMSHELRTPLNAIIGFSDMIIQEQLLKLEAVQRREYAQLINDSGQHLLSVVNGILDMSKIESGSFEISPEPFAPRPALLSCCNLLALKARENGVDLSVNATQDLPEITGDPRAFKQIVLNLVSNAIKFTERGGKVTVTAVSEGPRFVLRVADTGVGIATDDLKRLGDPFFQAGKTYQRRHEGTGLGLSIVKNLVSLHDGEMTVQSKVDEGTTVTVELPLVYTKPADAQPSSNVTPLRIAKQDPLTQVKKSA